MRLWSSQAISAFLSCLKLYNRSNKIRKWFRIVFYFYDTWKITVEHDLFLVFVASHFSSSASVVVVVAVVAVADNAIPLDNPNRSDRLTHALCRLDQTTHTFRQHIHLLPVRSMMVKWVNIYCAMTFPRVNYIITSMAVRNGGHNFTHIVPLVHRRIETVFPFRCINRNSRAHSNLFHFFACKLFSKHVRRWKRKTQPLYWYNCLLVLIHCCRGGRGDESPKKRWKKKREHTTPDRNGRAHIEQKSSGKRSGIMYSMMIEIK